MEIKNKNYRQNGKCTAKIEEMKNCELYKSCLGDICRNVSVGWPGEERNCLSHITEQTEKVSGE